MLFRSELLHIILCKEVKSYEKNWLEYQMKETGIFWNNLTFYRSERKLVITLQFFLHRMLFNYILAGIFIGSLVKIFCRKSCQGKLCANWYKFSRQKSYFFLGSFFINLIEIAYKTNKILCWIWNLWFIEHIYRK